MITDINNKDELISKLNHAEDQLVIIVFYATWCGVCRSLEPKYLDLVTEFPTLDMLKVPVDLCEDVAMDYDVSAVPTYVFIKTKTPVFKYIGSKFDKVKAAVLQYK